MVVAAASGVNGRLRAWRPDAERQIVGRRMALVTPGIRPAGATAGDQKRIMTPAAAIKAGSDYLVVGRPITGVSDPKAFWRNLFAVTGVDLQVDQPLSGRDPNDKTVK